MSKRDAAPEITRAVLAHLGNPAHARAYCSGVAVWIEGPAPIPALPSPAQWSGKRGAWYVDVRKGLPAAAAPAPVAEVRAMARDWAREDGCTTCGAESLRRCVCPAAPAPLPAPLPAPRPSRMESNPAKRTAPKRRTYPKRLLDAGYTPAELDALWAEEEALAARGRASGFWMDPVQPWQLPGEVAVQAGETFRAYLEHGADPNVAAALRKAGARPDQIAWMDPRQILPEIYQRTWTRIGRRAGGEWKHDFPAAAYYDREDVQNARDEWHAAHDTARDRVARSVAA